MEQVVHANRMCCCFGLVFYCLDNRCHTKTATSAAAVETNDSPGVGQYFSRALSICQSGSNHGVDLKTEPVHFYIIISELPLGNFVHSDSRTESGTVQLAPILGHRTRFKCLIIQKFTYLCTVLTFKN